MEMETYPKGYWSRERCWERQRTMEWVNGGMCVRYVWGGVIVGGRILYVPRLNL